MLVKACTITNNRGDAIDFGHHFKLVGGIDLSNLTATVNYSETTADGGHYQNTKLNVRDLDVTFYIDNEDATIAWLEDKRVEIFRVFNPKFNPMRLDFTSKGNHSYYLHVNLAGTAELIEDDDCAVATGWQEGLLQFICTDPHIYQKDARKVDIAVWIDAFEFPLEIPDGEGIEMGYRAPSLIVNVHNDGQDQTGMDIRFTALATVIKPSLINVNTYEEFKLNCTMLPGDIIEVSTYKGSRSITLIRNNIKTNIFNQLVLSSTFLQLDVGDNLFRYDAESGIDQLEVSMSYRERMVGV